MTTRTAKAKAHVAPKMTAHHYEYLAAWLADELPLTGLDGDTLDVVAASLAKRLRGTNPSYDRATFLSVAVAGR